MSIAAWRGAVCVSYTLHIYQEGSVSVGAHNQTQSHWALRRHQYAEHIYMGCRTPRGDEGAVDKYTILHALNMNLNGNGRKNKTVE